MAAAPAGPAPADDGEPGCVVGAETPDAAARPVGRTAASGAVRAGRCEAWCRGAWPAAVGASGAPVAIATPPSGAAEPCRLAVAIAATEPSLLAVFAAAVSA